MHTFSETGAGVPAFLAKLWRLVEDPETNNLICWSKDGRSFIIQNQAQFARELLPLNYKHNNMASFIRQLNMYGFHKITSIDNGGLKFDRDEMEFTHPCFKRNCPYLLEHIKRKIASTKSVDEKSALKPEAVTKVLQDVKAMRGRQDSLDSRFSVMKQENEALWREIASLRQKHAKQQQIVNKLIQFLITIVQPQRNMTSVKRHMQLMINDIPDKAKLRKSSESESECGPVIHELGEELLDEVADVEPELMVPHSPFGQPSTPLTTDPEAAASPQHIERPQSSISMVSQNYDYSNQSADDVIAGYMSPNLNSAAASSQSDNLVQSVNTDGSKIFYHITEVPDAHPNESTSPANINFNEENVLTTPMVREEMVRSQLLKQKNRQRRTRNGASSENLSATSTNGGKAKQQRVGTPQPQQQQQQQQQPQQQQQQMNQSQQRVPQPIQIKAEQDVIDPMMYLNVYPDNRVMTPDPHLISPNVSEDSRQSNSNNAGNNFMQNNNNNNNTSQSVAISADDNDLLGNNSSDLYNPNSFITNDIPADIFEDNSIMSAGDNSNFVADDSYKLNKQQQFGRATVNSGKFSSYMAGANNVNNINNAANNGSGPSTSAAAAGIANRNQAMDPTPSSTTSAPSTSKSSDNNMAVAKYNRGHEDVMRLSTATEVSGHLDFVQDELDTLKDLLRSDVYSLDHNTLLGKSLNGCTSTTNSTTNTKPISKFNAYENNNNHIFLSPAMEADIMNKLFNDSDILGTYGLHLANDGNNERKGSELMAYQPMYDLSDIINDQNNLEADNNILIGSPLRPQLTQTPQLSVAESTSSVLNTPYHQ